MLWLWWYPDICAVKKWRSCQVVSREVLHLTGHAVPGRSSRIFSTTLTAMDMKSFKAKNGSFRRPGVQCLTSRFLPLLSQIMYTIIEAFFRAFAGFSRLLPLRAYQVDGASSCGCQMWLAHSTPRASHELCEVFCSIRFFLHLHPKLRMLSNSSGKECGRTVLYAL